MEEVRVVAFSGADQQHICQIRETVFGQEQNISRALDLDGEDPQAWHALVFVDGQPVATGRILADGHIGRVAVLKSSRGKGMGAKVVMRWLSLRKSRAIHGSSWAHKVMQWIFTIA